MQNVVKLAARRALALGPPRARRRTHYDTLGVSRNASKEEVRAAFVALCKRHHPDVNPGLPADSQSAFIKVNHAYSVLSNPESRQRYDQELSVAQAYAAQHSSRVDQKDYYYAGSASRSAAGASTTPPFGSRPSWHGRPVYEHSFRDADWSPEAGYRRPHQNGGPSSGHGRLVTFLVGLMLFASGVHALRIHHAHRQLRDKADEETRRNTRTYMEVKERARASTMEEQLQRLRERHTETLKKLPPRG